MAIAFENSTVVNDQSGTINVSFNVGTKPGRLLVFCNTFFNGAGGKSTQSATYNGVSLTKLTGDASGGFYTDMWYLFNPASGTNTLTINTGVPSESNGGVAIMAFSGVDSKILPTIASNTGTSASISGSITPTYSNSLIIDVVKIQRTAMTCGQNQIMNRFWTDGPNFLTGSSWKINETGTGTLTWTPNGSAGWATYLGAFAPIQEGGSFLYHLI